MTKPANHPWLTPYLTVASGRASLDFYERAFGFTPGPNTRVTVEDGRVFVKRQGRAHASYDLIMLDAEWQGPRAGDADVSIRARA